jgi:hypothetical protein
MKSEYAIWRDEIERPRLSVAERVARWFERPSPTEPAKPDHYRWASVSDLMPIAEEGQ